MALTSLSNGVAIAPGQVRALIDANKRTWTSPSTGIVFKLKPLSIGLMNRIRSDRTGRPDIPMIHVKYGEQDAWEPNPNDPVYLQKLADWNSDIGTRQAAFCYNAVDIEIPNEFVADVVQWHPDPTEAELKYYYVTSLVPASEYDALTNAILGQTAPTEEGIKDASAAFPDAGERRTD